MTRTVIQFRCSGEQKKLIEGFAKDAGQSIGEYVLRAVLSRMWHETTSPPDRPVPKKKSYGPDPR